MRRMIQWLRVLSSSPNEFKERFASAIENRRESQFDGGSAYGPLVFKEALSTLEHVLDRELLTVEAETGLLEIADDVRNRQLELRDNAPWPITTDGGELLAKTCYILVRTLKPETVVETGVAYGVTSAYILKALAINGTGKLHSIDLPPLRKDAGEFVGALIPKELQNNWYLHRGSSRQMLPRLLNKVGSVDMFVHDSLHTYPTMKWEFKTVEPCLSESGILVADDIQSNAAFKEWSDESHGRFALAVDEPSKHAIFGVAVSTRSEAKV